MHIGTININEKNMMLDTKRIGAKALFSKMSYLILVIPTSFLVIPTFFLVILKPNTLP
jgi:hypothetical protein